MKSKPTEMSLVSGGLNAEEMNEILGARCVCSVGSADNNIDGGGACQCSYGEENFKANGRIAGVPEWILELAVK